MTPANDPAAPATTPDDKPAVPEPSSGAESFIPIQPVPPPVTSVPEAPVPKPQRQPLTPEIMAAEIARLDRVLVGIVLALAFFLGSFRATNSDLWMHLASGRAIARGEYRFHGDPFAFTTGPGPSTWVNSSWLSDLALYGLSWAKGGEDLPLRGALLVILKALVVTALAEFMLRIRRPGQSLWIPAACTALALVAASQRFFLQSTCISYLFLALTLLLLLERPQIKDGRTKKTALIPPRLWPFTLPLLFALWANLDSWFLLGPLTVGLFLLGETLQQFLAPIRTGVDAPEPGDRRTLVFVLIGGLAAPLLNPYHVRVFAWPPDLWPAVSGSPLRSDVLFNSLFLSPLSKDYFGPLGAGLTVVGLAYLPLVLLGMVSFALASPDWRCWRLLVWLVFFGLSAWLSRLIPFFAVVAGPITALNFQDFAARRFGTEPRVEGRAKNWSLLGRVGTAALGLFLLAMAWPGWLHSTPGDPRSGRRVAWEVNTDPSLLRAAHKLSDLRREGGLGNGFNLNPDSANYFAWFCPEEKGFLDLRFPLFAQVMQPYEEVRQMLQPGDDSPASSSPEWQQIFRDYHIDHVVVSDANAGVPLASMSRLLGDGAHWPWTLLYMDGRTVIFGWTDPAHPDAANSFKERRFDPALAAFGPNPGPENQAPREAPPPPQPRTLWGDYARGFGPRPLGADEAEMDRLYFEKKGGRARVAYSLSRRILALAGPGAELIPIQGALPFLFPIWDDLLLRGQGVAPPAPLLLSVRAARRAVAENPKDADSYLALADAYTQLWKAQEEPVGGSFTRLQTLRPIQVAAALQHAMVLEPKSESAHLLLANLLESMGSFDDLVLDQWEQGIRQTEAKGPLPRESPDAFRKRLDSMNQVAEAKKKNINLQIDDYELKITDAMPPLRKAQMALARRLGGRALQVLQEKAEAIPPEQLKDSADLLLRLLIQTGQMEKAQDLAKEMVTDPFNQFLIDAALGDYVAADESLTRQVNSLEKTLVTRLLGTIRGQALETILEPTSLRDLNLLADGVQDKATFLTLRGLLALETGDTNAARKLFQGALDVGTPPQAGRTGPTFYFPAQPLALYYLKALKEARKE